MSVIALPIPPHHRTVADVLATAQRQDVDNVLVLSEVDHGYLILHNDLTAATLLWMLEKAKEMVLRGQPIELCDPKEIG